MASTDLTINLAIGLLDFMRVRKIRNSCRYYMTRDHSYISRWHQFLYYRNYKQAINRNYLYLARNKQGHYIGYGLIRYNQDSTPWLTGAILKEYRGKGYGEALFSSLVLRCHSKIVYLEVLNDNTTARNLYRKLGFEISGHQGNIIIMKKNISHA